MNGNTIIGAGIKHTARADRGDRIYESAGGSGRVGICNAIARYRGREREGGREGGRGGEKVRRRGEERGEERRMEIAICTRGILQDTAGERSTSHLIT